MVDVEDFINELIEELDDKERENVTTPIEEEQAFIIRSDNPDEVFEKIQSLETVSGYKLSPAKPMTISDVFYDTPGGIIKTAKHSLRIRIITQGDEIRTEVTIKGKNTSKNSSSVRTEQNIEWPYQDPSPFDLVELFGFEELQVRTTERLAIDLVKPWDNVVAAELALDKVTYEFGDLNPTVYEVEIELKDEKTVGLDSLTKSIRKKIPELEPWKASKYATGKALDTALRINLNKDGIVTQDSFDSLYSLI